MLALSGQPCRYVAGWQACRWGSMPGPPRAGVFVCPPPSCMLLLYCCAAGETPSRERCGRSCLSWAGCDSTPLVQEGHQTQGADIYAAYFVQTACHTDVDASTSSISAPPGPPPAPVPKVGRPPLRLVGGVGISFVKGEPRERHEAYRQTLLSRGLEDGTAHTTREHV